MVELLERLGHEVEFRPEQTCCGQMHMNSGYRDEGAGAGRADAARVRRRRGDRDARRPRAPAHVLEHEPGLPVHELSQFLTGVLGVEDVGARYPARVAYHPTCHSLRALRVGDGPAPAAGRRRGPRAGRARRGRSVLRLRRHLRGQERGGVDGDARRQAVAPSSAAAREVVTAVDNSCLMQIGGGLSRARLAGAHRCTWPRSWRPREQRQARRRELPAGRARGAANAQLRANLGNATRTIRAKRARSRRRAATTGRSCARPARRSRRDVLANLDELPGRVRAGGRPRPVRTVHWARRRRRGERPWSRASSRATARTRW